MGGELDLMAMVCMKNFIILCFREDYFCIDAEWNFVEVSQGEGDGLGLEYN